MAGEESYAARKEKRSVAAAESLGWLTESTILPKKHKSIEGVGASSILELKAQLYRTQEDARRNKQDDVAEFIRARRKIEVPDVFSRKNSGVQSRAHRDKLELKAVNDGSASYAALEKKAELYEKLCRGEIEAEDETYCVDFFLKSTVQSEPSTCRDDRDDGGSGVYDEEDEVAVMAEKLIGPGRDEAFVDRDEHKRLVREVHEEANVERERAAEIKNKRREQEDARRERLKQTYLRKRLEKLKASSQLESS